MKIVEYLWRLLWSVPFYLGRALTWLSIAAVAGIPDANHWWEEQTWG